jgi:hypothetical protein
MRKYLAAIFLLAAPVFGANDTRLTIHITDNDNHPIGNASVIVKFKHGLNPIKMSKIRTSWEMRSSQEGIAKIPSLPKGQVQIQVIARNHQTFGQTFDVTEDERTIEIKLNPPQAQYSAHEK